MTTNFKFPYNGQTVDFDDYYVRVDPFTQGTLWNVGLGSSGQLGDNTAVNKSSPVQTVAFGQNWRLISCGVLAKLGLKTDGTLWGWGLNTSGGLGDNTTVNKSSPVQTVAYGTNWVTASMGSTTSAGIKTDGTLWLWGNNGNGQVGDNTTVSKSSPVQTVAFGTNWLKVSCGYKHCHAIKTNGTLWSWGNNAYGQLGDNTTVAKSSPVQTVTFASNWIQVSSGGSQQAASMKFFAGAIKSDGTLWGWGHNGYGQLGDNTTVLKSSPVQTVSFGTNWKTCSFGFGSGAGIKNDGTLWTWGRNNFGQLGDNTTIHKSSPVQTVVGGNTWINVSIGYNTLAIKSDGTLWAWGVNSQGHLGDNTTVDKSSPIQTVLGGTNWKTISTTNSATSANNATCGYIYRIDPTI